MNDKSISCICAVGTWSCPNIYGYVSPAIRRVWCGETADSDRRGTHTR